MSETEEGFWVRSDRIKFVLEALESAIAKTADVDVIRVLVMQARYDILRMQEYG